ncbi:hypothetical protein Tco_0366461 [Tanacetum coccineum]
MERKQAKETTEATPPAKRAKAGKVAKKRTLKKSQQLVDEFVDEGIPLTEPGFGDLEADTQKGYEESSDGCLGATIGGPLPPMGCFRETDIESFQPLRVRGKEKRKSVRASWPRCMESVRKCSRVVKSGAPATKARLGTKIPGIQMAGSGWTKPLQRLCFGEQFFNDKPPEANNEKATTDTEAESMVSVTIHQDTSVIPPMTSPVINLVSVPDSPTVHRPLPTTTTATATTTTTIMTTIPLPPQPQQFPLFYLNTQSLGASGASGSSQSPPPPLPPSNNQGGQSTSTAAPSSSKTAASAEYTAWTTTDTRIKPSVSPIPEDLHMGERYDAVEQAYHLVGLEINTDLIILAFMDWYCKKQGISELTQKHLEGPAYEIVKVFHPDVVHLQFQMEECHKLLTDQVDDAILRYNVSKPLPLGGDPGHVTIQPNFFFNKDLEYLRYGRKMGRPALSISKMKAAYYPDVGLEQMVLDQIWIEEECKYDVAAMYGISHWWFQRQRFYIDRHTSEGDRKGVRTHMRILSVVRIEVFSMYGYNYMKKIVLRRADLKEYVIAERDFKYLYPNDFEDLYLLNLQGHLNHLSPEDKKILTTAINLWTRNLVIRQRVEDFQLGIESYQMQLNLTKPRWDAKGFEYKHEFIVIDSPRAVTFRDNVRTAVEKDIILGIIQARVLIRSNFMRKCCWQKQDEAGVILTTESRMIFSFVADASKMEEIGKN